MFSINQNDFSFQDGVCRLASAINMCYNNILHKGVDSDELKKIDHYCVYEHKIPMGKGGGQIVGGINRINGFIEKYYGIKGKIVNARLGTKILDKYLDKGLCAAISINSSNDFQNMRKNSDVISGDFTKATGINGHRILLFKNNNEYYFLNSRYGDSRDIKKVDMKVQGLFKDTLTTILL